MSSGPAWLDPAAQRVATIHVDALAKWQAGRDKYGPEWGGDPRGPVAELYAEMLDALNYIEEGRRRGEIDAERGARWRGRILRVALEVREALGGEPGA